MIVPDNPCRRRHAPIPVDVLAASILTAEHAAGEHRPGSRPYCPVCQPNGPQRAVRKVQGPRIHRNGYREGR